MIQKPKDLAVANTVFIFILSFLNGGSMALNLQLEYSLPILPILFFSFSTLFNGFLDVLRKPTRIRNRTTKKSSDSSSLTLVDLECSGICCLNYFCINIK
jgi:hypothetical protein